MSGPRTLIVGADGEIATALSASLRARDWPVTDTSRRGTPGAVPLDLSADPATWPKGGADGPFGDKQSLGQKTVAEAMAASGS